MIGIEVLNEHKRHAGIGGHGPEEGAESLQASGRGAYSHDQGDRALLSRGRHRAFDRYVCFPRWIIGGIVGGHWLTRSES